MKNNLYELIQSLSTSEKRYFKTFIKQISTKQGQYLELFDAFSRQKEYNEAKLKRKFAGTKLPTQWSVYKGYLYKLILRSLQNYHHQRYIEYEILDALQCVRILVEKQLFEQATEILQKAKAKATNYGKVLLLPQLWYWEMILLEMQLSKQIENPQQKLEVLKRDSIQISNLTSNFLACLHQKTAISYIHTGLSDTADIVKHYRTILAQPMFEEETFAQSNIARIYINMAKLSMFGQMRQYHEAMVAAMQCIESYEDSEYLQQEYFYGFANALRSAMNFATFAQNWSTFASLSEKATTLSQQIKQPQKKSYVQKFVLQENLLFQLKTGNFETPNNLISEINEFLKTEQDKIPLFDLIIFHFELAYWFVGLEQWDKALKELIFFEDLSSKIYPPIQMQVKIIRLIILFEQHEFLLLPYQVRSVYNDFNTENLLTKFYRIMLNLLKKLADTIDAHEQKKVFVYYKIKLKTQLAQANNDEINPLDYFNYMAWIESKITKQSLGQAIQNMIK